MTSEEARYLAQGHAWLRAAEGHAARGNHARAVELADRARGYFERVAPPE